MNRRALLLLPLTLFGRGGKENSRKAFARAWSELDDARREFGPQWNHAIQSPPGPWTIDARLFEAWQKVEDASRQMISAGRRALAGLAKGE